MERLIKNRNLIINFFLLIVLIVFNYGCKNDKINHNSVVNIEQKRNIERKENNEKDWIQLEKDVFKCIELINKSDKSNRKELLKEFVTYANEVDGAIAEGYFGFAFDYPIENPDKFFSVLEKKDYLLVEKWAEAAVGEYMLTFDNIDSPKEFEKKIRNNFIRSIKNFDISQKIIAEHYLNKIMEISNKVYENTTTNDNLNIIIDQDKIDSANKKNRKNIFLSSFYPRYELSNKNVLEKYKNYDFSKIWLKINDNFVLGTIGENNQRIRIKFLKIYKNPKNKFEYFVEGKSKVKSNICEFSGNIYLTSIIENKHINYGVDDEYKNKGIKAQGFLIANYEFFENKNQKNSGKFIGEVYSKWYIDSNNSIIYDDIESISDSYTNNTFLGEWISYKTNKYKNCSWSDYRVPDGTSDLDIGAAEFSPNEKYFDKGWKNYFNDTDKNWWK